MPSYEAARNRLVDDLARAGVVRSPGIAAAFRATPREAFVAEGSPAAVYADSVIPLSSDTGEWLTNSSQPTMMALMLEQLGVRRGDHVLEIGAGTGYNAAVLAALAGPEGSVDSVEVVEQAARHASRALARVGSTARAHYADGADGWPEGAPYDRILSTVAVWDVPAAWLDQAAPEARLVAPVTILGADYSLRFDRDADAWRGGGPEPCAFVRFKGRLPHPDDRYTVRGRSASDVVLTAEPEGVPHAAGLGAWFESGQGEPLDGFCERGAWDGFLFWLLAWNGPRRAVRSVSASRALGWQGQAVGLWDEGGISLVTASGRLEWFGGGETREELLACHAMWKRAGRPASDAFRLSFVRGLQPAGPGVLPREAHTLLIEG